MLWCTRNIEILLKSKTRLLSIYDEKSQWTILLMVYESEFYKLTIRHRTFTWGTGLIR